MKFHLYSVPNWIYLKFKSSIIHLDLIPNKKLKIDIGIKFYHMQILISLRPLIIL